MHFTKTAAFSPDCKYFSAFSADDKLLIWETLSSDFIDCKYESSVCSTCTSLHWILIHKYASPNKAEKLQNLPSDISYFLAIGTAKGDLLLYNIVYKNLYSHLVGCHSGAVNDICFCSETSSIITCSNDGSIAISDITTGRQKKKWIADDGPVTSICVIDDNNLLSSSTSIMWWNISKKSVLKKFSSHSTSIFRLLPVNATSLNSCYFLSAAVNDFEINAWSLNSVHCQTPVASFVLPEQPHQIDISNFSYKDKPLLLSTVTKSGVLYLFEHILNGNLNQPIQPTASLEINVESSDMSFISTKLSSDSKSCIVAYGSSKSNITFKHINVKDFLNRKETEAQNISVTKRRSPSKLSAVQETNKIDRGLPINGVKSVSTLENSQTVTCLKDADAVIRSHQRKLRSSSKTAPLTQSEILNTSRTEDVESSCQSRHLKESKNSMSILLGGLKTKNEDAISEILHNSDTEFISSFVRCLPRSSLKDVLSELNHRLHNQEKYSPTLSKWLKEILRIHLNYLIESKDTVEILNYIKKQVDSMQVNETVSKLCVLKGFLNLQMQNSSSEESDSSSEELMEL